MHTLDTGKIMYFISLQVRYTNQRKKTCFQISVIIQGTTILLRTVNGRQYTLFIISNTFISNARLKLEKNKQKLSNTLRLNIHNLKIIRFFHPCYHPKIIGDIPKNVQKTSASVLMTLYD